MMGYPGTSNSKLVDPSLGMQRRDEFRVQARGSATEPSEPSLSDGLHGQHPLFVPPLHHQPAVPFRPAESEALSNRDFGGGSAGPRNCAQERIQNRQQQQRVGKSVKESKSTKWEDMETSILLECMVSGGRFVKDHELGHMQWDLIADEINGRNNGKHQRSGKKCQNRFDTLKKAYKVLHTYCCRTGKEFCQVTKREKKDLKMATPIGEKNEEWYNHLHTINMWRESLSGKSDMRLKPNGGSEMGVSEPTSSLIRASRLWAPPSDVIGSSKSMKPSVVQEFNGLKEALRYTFLNLIQVMSLKTRQTLDDHYFEEQLSLELLYRRLAIVQDQNPLQVRNHVYRLERCNLVTLYDTDFVDDVFGDCSVERKVLRPFDFEVYKKLVRKVLSKNPHLNTIRRLPKTAVSVTNLSLLQQIRVLNLHECQELENIDLVNLPHLCCLDIMDCANLKDVSGWEVAKGLGWIEICGCNSYGNFPDVQFLHSLKEFAIEKHAGQRTDWQLANFSHCVQLRRLEITGDSFFVESMDLKALRSLEVLSFSYCKALTTIHGLSGLQTLIKLNVEGCESLKMVRDLGCLKALTYLNMSHTGIIEMRGVEELHLLTWLDLSECLSLESLPPLGHLKALAHLDLGDSSIEEIPGVENLLSLETLICSGSELKQLPILDHLLRLCEIRLDDTPLSRMDSSRSFIGREEMIDKDRKKEGLFLDVISDMSDMNDDEYNSSDEGSIW